MDNFWRRVAAFVLKHHKGIVVATLILVVLSIISAGNIQVTTKMKDMLPAGNPQVQMMDEVEQHFSGGTSLFITIEGDDRETMVACAEALVAEIEARAELREYIRTINLKLDKDFIIRWGLLLQEAEDLADLKARFAQINLLPFLRAVNDSFEETYIDNSEEETLHEQAGERGGGDAWQVGDLLYPSPELLNQSGHRSPPGTRSAADGGFYPRRCLRFQPG